MAATLRSPLDSDCACGSVNDSRVTTSDDGGVSCHAAPAPMATATVVTADHMARVRRLRGRPLEETCKVGITTVDPAPTGASRTAGLGGWSGGAAAIGASIVALRRGDRGDVRREAIAASSHRDDVVLVLRALTKSLAIVRDRAGEIVLFDVSVRPDFGQQEVLFQQAAAVPHQHEQGVKGLGQQWHQYAVALEGSRTPIQAKRAKGE